MGLFRKLFGKGSDGKASSAEASAATDTWSFGPFSIRAHPGFSYMTGRAPAVYGNAAGDVLMITVNVLSGKPTKDEAPGIVKNAIDHARKIFQSSAARFGSANSAESVVVRPDGHSLLSFPVQTSDDTGASYLLQYALVSPLGNLAVMTFEGRGIIAHAIEDVEASVATARFAT